MSEEIKAVVFDIGGVVAGEPVTDTPRTSSAEIIARLYGRPLEEVHSVAGKYAELMTLGNMSEASFWESVSREFNQPIPAGWESVWHGLGGRDYERNQPVVSLVEEVRNMGLLALVLSNANPMQVEFNRSIGNYDGFDAVYLSCEIGKKKPQKEAFYHVLESHGLTGPDAIMVDDLERNIKAALELGMKGVLAQSPEQVVRDVRKLLMRNG